MKFDNEYKRFLVFIFLVSLILLVLIFISNLLHSDSTTNTNDYNSYTNDTDILIVNNIPKDQVCEIDPDWEIFIDALVWVESTKKDSVINKKSGATGYFQIMPVFVKEANRLQNEELFTLDDRFSYKRSRMMFDIIQEHKNPTKDKRLACRIHYGSYDKNYYNKVMTKYKELLYCLDKEIYVHNTYNNSNKQISKEVKYEITFTTFK